MFHGILPFPFGAREGELVIRVGQIADEPLDAIADIMTAIYGRPGGRRDIWVDGAEISGTGHKAGLVLRRFGDLVLTGPVGSAWPRIAGRIVVDMSAYLATPVADRSEWLDDISRVITRSQPADELVVIAPAMEMLDAATLHELDVLSRTAEGGTLYVAEAAMERAIVASSRAAMRPWRVRRLGSLPPHMTVTAGAPARAASPAA